MCRLRFIEPAKANPATKKLLKKMVLVPNLLCIMANSDSAIEAFTFLNNSLNTSKLSIKLRKIISLAVSQFNDCNYCVALHTTTAVESGLLTHQECLDARRMLSTDRKGQAVLILTRAILENRGNVETEIINDIKKSGIDDQEVLEIITTISFITMANYVANVADPDIDFPQPPSLEELAAGPMNSGHLSQ